MAFNYQQGLYAPEHPEKYIGDVSKIRYMSSWELHCFRYLDNNPNILQWSSEEIAIDYVKPTTRRIHKYYPDLFVCVQTKDGSIKWELIEIKPLAQTKTPRANTKYQLQQQLTFEVNVAKWEAANRWCEAQSKITGVPITFRVLTERQIFQ